jgi:hypothetical protein
MENAKVPLFLISYDINEKDAFEYGPLWAKLRAIGATKILFSEWVIPGDIGDTGKIYGWIAPIIQDKDRLLVQEIMREAYWDKLLISDDAFKKLLNDHARW